MKLFKSFRLNLLLVCFIAMSASGQTENPEQPKLTIGVYESPPFIMQVEGQYTGLSVDIWEQIAIERGYSYEYKNYQSLSDLIEAISTTEVDLSINPLTVTSERLKKFSFTQPFFISSVGIAVAVKDSSPVFSLIKKFFSRQFFEIVFLLFIVIFIFGFILWLVERKKNPQHFEKGWRGIGDGIWWSAVTMTTVGYGDKAPKTGLGRVISVIWMFTAVIIISGFTASISAALTYNKLQTSISTIEDLHTVKVGTVKNSSTAEFLNDRRIEYYAYETLEIAINELNERRIEAVIYDSPLLSYYINSKALHQDADIIPSGVNSIYFSFSSTNVTILDAIDPALIAIIESPGWNKMLSKYNLHNH
jgi:ABC-type amino acid transport substrate-binding protein